MAAVVGQERVETMDAVRGMMRESGIGARELSRRLGRSDNFVQNTLTRDDMGAMRLARMAELMGYRLVLVGDGDPMVVGRREDGDAC